jgi:protein tyrosine/serine phosphatase
MIFATKALCRTARTHHLALMLSLFICLPHISCASYTVSRNYPGINIKNFGRINENYYRGGQPESRDFAALKKLGIRTVIDLRIDKLEEEAGWVTDAGMTYYLIPLTGNRPATAEQTEYFLKLVNDPANLPVYVHCAAGRHRTGEMTAIYRIAHDSWTADQAYAEMKKYGFYSFPNHGSLKDYVYQYYQSRPAAQ